MYISKAVKMSKEFLVLVDLRLQFGKERNIEEVMRNTKGFKW